jgi:hypothetical protein
LKHPINSLHQPTDLLAENTAFKHHLSTFDGLENAIDDYQFSLTDIELGEVSGNLALDGLMNGLLISNELDASVGLLKSLLNQEEFTYLDAVPQRKAFADMRRNGTCITQDAMQGLLLAHMMDNLACRQAINQGELNKALVGLNHFQQQFQEQLNTHRLSDENTYLDSATARFATELLIPRISELEAKLESELGKLEALHKSNIPTHAERVKRAPTLSPEELAKAIKAGEESGVVRRIGSGKKPDGDTSPSR